MNANPSAAMLNPDLSHWPTEVVRDKVIVEGQIFLIERPEDGPNVVSAPPPGLDLTSANVLPFWTEIWPSARMLAKVLIAEPLTSGQQALEVGCGLGLPGIVALSK